VTRPAPVNTTRAAAANEPGLEQSNKKSAKALWHPGDAQALADRFKGSIVQRFNDPPPHLELLNI
jgi:hypothetical protein